MYVTAWIWQKHTLKTYCANIRKTLFEHYTANVSFATFARCFRIYVAGTSAMVCCDDVTARIWLNIPLKTYCANIRKTLCEHYTANVSFATFARCFRIYVDGISEMVCCDDVTAWIWQKHTLKTYCANIRETLFEHYTANVSFATFARCFRIYVAGTSAENVRNLHSENIVSK